MSIAVSRDMQWMATGSMTREAGTAIWSLPRRMLLLRISPYYSSTVAFTPDSQALMRAWDTMNAWSVPAGQRIWEFMPVYGGVVDVGVSGSSVTWFVALGPTGQWFATNWGSGVKVGSTIDNSFDLTLAARRPYAAAAFSPDGKTLATSGPALWSLPDGQRIWPAATPAPSNGDNSALDNWVAFSPDGTYILVSDFAPTGPWVTDDKSYTTVSKLYRASDGALVRDFGTSLSRRPAFSPDGSWIVAGRAVFPLLSGPPVYLSPTPGDGVSAFAPDGTIAFGGSDGIVRLFCPQ